MPNKPSTNYDLSYSLTPDDYGKIHIWLCSLPLEYRDKTWELVRDIMIFGVFKKPETSK